MTVAGGTLGGSLTVGGNMTSTGGTISGSPTLTGSLTVNSGTALAVNGTIASTSVAVTSGGELQGSGTITSPVVTLTGGKITPGTLGTAGTIHVTGNVTLDHASVLNYDLATPGVAGGTTNDLIDITGGLSLDGTLNISGLAPFAVGTYRLFNYTTTLTGAGLTIGLIPDNTLYYTVDTRTTGQVNLDVSPYMPGDTDHSGGTTLNSLDIDAILQHFGYAATSQWKVYPDNNPVGQEDVSYELNHYFHTTYGDANLDPNHRVDFLDFQVLLDNWGGSGGWAAGDFNGDGTVDFLDFQKILDYWNPGGWTIAASQVPEPATLSLLALGGLALLRRSRK